MTLADPKPADAKQVDSIKIVEGKGKKAPSIKLKDKPLSVSQTTRTVLDKGRGKTLPDDAFVEVDLAMFSGKDGKLIRGFGDLLVLTDRPHPGQRGLAARSGEVAQGTEDRCARRRRDASRGPLRRAGRAPVRRRRQGQPRARLRRAWGPCPTRPRAPPCHPRRACRR
uniref:Uncharacterized protein n=1 Tax=Janibacter limosus TaxID=53458 RepID=A0AC61U7U7_9MICO|nr:hypothetical protein [Janibacter limosus]